MTELDDLKWHLVLKDHNERDGLKGGEHRRSVGLNIDRAVVSLAEHLDGSVAVDSDDEARAEATGLRKIGDVATVEDVEDAVRHDDGMRERASARLQLAHSANLAFEDGSGKTGAHGRLLSLSWLNQGERTASARLAKARVALAESFGAACPFVPS